MTNTFSILNRCSKPFVFASSQMADMKHSTYGGLKFIGERYTRSLSGVTARFWNIYGPEKDLKKSHVITDFILKAKRESKIEIITDGTETRQFLHAEDCSRALYMISKNYNMFAGGSIDITGFEWTSILDIAKLVSKKFNNVPVIPGNKIDKVHNSDLSKLSNDDLVKAYMDFMKVYIEEHKKRLLDNSLKCNGKFFCPDFASK